jgi:hypothetical protein
MQRRVIFRTLFVLVAAAAVALLVWGDRNRRQVADLEVRLAAAQQQLAGMVAREELETARRSVAELEKTVADLKSQLEPSDGKGEASATEEAAQGKALLEMFASMADTQQTAETGNGLTNMLSRMFGGESGKQLADYSARMSVNMYYGDLFRELNLPPETEQQVRDIITRHMTDQIAQGMEMLQQQSDPETVKRMEEEATKRLRDELSQVLTGEEMAFWDEYQETMQQRVLDQSYDMQLSMFATGLTPESRDVVRQAIVDEMLASSPHGLQYPQTTEAALETAIDIQRGAFTRARARVAEQLLEDQLAHFDRFVETQEQMLDMALQMMRNMAGQVQAQQQ